MTNSKTTSIKKRKKRTTLLTSMKKIFVMLLVLNMSMEVKEAQALKTDGSLIFEATDTGSVVVEEVGGSLTITGTGAVVDTSTATMTVGKDVLIENEAGLDVSANAATVGSNLTLSGTGSYANIGNNLTIVSGNLNLTNTDTNALTITDGITSLQQGSLNLYNGSADIDATLNILKGNLSLTNGSLLTLGSSSATTISQGSVNINASTLDLQGTMTLSKDDFTASGSSSVDISGTLNMLSSHFYAESGASITVDDSGELNSKYITVSNDSEFYINSNATVSTNDFNLIESELTIDGTLEVGNNFNLYGTTTEADISGTLEVKNVNIYSGAVLDLSAGQDISNTLTVNGAGSTFDMSSASSETLLVNTAVNVQDEGTLSLGANILKTTTFNVDHGFIDTLAGSDIYTTGNLNIAMNSQFDNNGIITTDGLLNVYSGSILGFNSTDTITVGTGFVVNNATVNSYAGNDINITTGNLTITNNAIFNDKDGTITTEQDGIFVQSGGQFKLDGSTITAENGFTVNAGTVESISNASNFTITTGDLIIANSGMFIDQGGTITTDQDGIFVQSGGLLSLTSTGVTSENGFTVNNGDVESAIGTIFYITTGDLIIANSGTFSDQGGTITTEQDGIFVQSSGQFLLDGSTLTSADSLTINGGSLTSTSGTSFDITGSLLVGNGSLSDTAGTIDVAGDIEIYSSGVLNLTQSTVDANANTLTISGGTVNQYESEMDIDSFTMTGGTFTTTAVNAYVAGTSPTNNTTTVNTDSTLTNATFTINDIAKFETETFTATNSLITISHSDTLDKTIENLTTESLTTTSSVMNTKGGLVSVTDSDLKMTSSSLTTDTTAFNIANDFVLASSHVSSVEGTEFNIANDLTASSGSIQAFDTTKFYVTGNTTLSSGNIFILNDQAELKTDILTAESSHIYVIGNNENSTSLISTVADLTFTKNSSLTVSDNSTLDIGGIASFTDSSLSSNSGIITFNDGFEATNSTITFTDGEFDVTGDTVVKGSSLTVTNTQNTDVIHTFSGNLDIQGSQITVIGAGFDVSGDTSFDSSSQLTINADDFFLNYEEYQENPATGVTYAITSDTLDVAEGSTLKINGGKAGDIIFVATGAAGATPTAFTTTTDHAWDSSTIFNNMLITADTDYTTYDGTSYSIVLASLDANDVFTLADASTNTLLNTLNTVNGSSSTYDTDSSDMAVRFLSRATSLDNGGGTTSTVATVEGAAQLAIIGAAGQSTLSIANTALNSLGYRIFTDEQFTNGLDIWFTPSYQMEKAEDIEVGKLKNSYDMNYFTASIGLDYTAAEIFRTGVAFTLGSGEVESSGVFNKTKNELDFMSVSAYTGLNFTGTSFMLKANYVTNTNDIEQTLPSQMEMENLKSSFDTSAIVLGIEAEHKIELESINIIPRAGFNYTMLSTPSYEVESAGKKIYDIEKQDQKIMSFPASIAVTHDNQLDESWTLKTQVEAGAIFSFGDTTTETKARSSSGSLSSSLVSIESQLVDETTIKAGIGAQITNGNFSFDVDVDTRFSKSYTGVGVSGNIRYNF